MSLCLTKRRLLRQISSLNNQLSDIVVEHRGTIQRMSHENDLLKGRLSFLALRYHDALLEVSSWPQHLREISDARVRGAESRNFGPLSSHFVVMENEGRESAEPIYAALDFSGSAAGVAVTGRVTAAQQGVEERGVFDSVSISEVEEIDRVSFLFYFSLSLSSHLIIMFLLVIF